MSREGIRAVDGSTNSTFADVTRTATPEAGFADKHALDVAIKAQVAPLQISFQFDDVAPTLPAEDGFAVPRITEQRAVHVNLRSDDGTELGTTDNPIRATLPAVISTANSTTTPLGAAGVFTGTYEDIRGVSIVTVSIFTSHASATSGFSYQTSSDGVNWDGGDAFSIPATASGSAKVYSFGATTRYFRIVYTNGATPQTDFRLQTILHYISTKPSSHRIGDSILDEDDAELVKAVITGRSPDGIFRNTQTDQAGNLFVRDVSTFRSSIAFGDVFTTSISTVAVRRTAYTEPTANAQRSMSSSSAADTSAGTGARTVRLTYLTVTGTGPFTEVITLSGVTPVNTVATDICYIEKIEVISAGSGGTNAGTITLFGATAGGGGTVGTIGIGHSKTFWAHHYVPDGVLAKVTGIAVNNDNSTPANGSRFTLRSIALAANSVEMQLCGSVWTQGQSPETNRPLNSPAEVTGPARITLYVAANSGANVTHYGDFDYFEIDS